MGPTLLRSTWPDSRLVSSNTGLELEMMGVWNSVDPAIVQLICQECGISYVIADQGFTVVRGGGAVTTLASEGGAIIGRSLLSLFPELIGSEDMLFGILMGEQPRLDLKHINRTAPDGSTRYITLSVLPCWRETAGTALLVVAADASEQGRYAQALNQQRNELRLQHSNLSETNAHLDFLLRHYVPMEVADALLDERLVSQPGGELRQVSVLFADLRGYTRAAEQWSPSKTMEVLNAYLDVASNAVAAAGGTVVQFMGDAVMALFNAPNDQPDHAWRAVRAGLNIQKMAEVHRFDGGADLPPLHFGVGINTGQAVVGNTGARWRYDYTAVGDTTNVAFRISTVARAREVWIGPTTFDLLPECVEAVPIEPMHFKGKEEPIVVYRAISVDEHAEVGENGTVDAVTGSHSCSAV